MCTEDKDSFLNKEHELAENEYLTDSDASWEAPHEIDSDTSWADEPRNVSWGVVVFLLIIYFPLGFYKLYQRLSFNRSKYYKSSLLMKMIGWFLMAFIVLIMILSFTLDPNQNVVFALIVGALVLFAGIFLLIKSHIVRKKDVEDNEYID